MSDNIHFLFFCYDIFCGEGKIWTKMKIWLLKWKKL
jgi:hypothetical protein